LALDEWRLSRETQRLGERLALMHAARRAITSSAPPS
jgi:hypothetical protein